MVKISTYILTYNSQKYLEKVIRPLVAFSDEIVIIDSGSSDQTVDIAEKFGARVIYRKFDNFSSQRQFAIDSCCYEWIFNVDSDEVADESFVEAMMSLKSKLHNIEFDAYRVQRYWYIMGQSVRSFYPVTSPDYVVRLFKKEKAFFDVSYSVHETVEGFDNISPNPISSINHYTFESKEEINRKLELYTDLAAQDAEMKGKRGGLLNSLIHAISAFIKWYLKNGAYKDGRIGLLGAKYAFCYTYKKYIKINKIRNRSISNI